MKTNITFPAILVSSFFILHSAFGQGALTPPGPPGPTMLTLSQIEPRTPVDATHTPGSAVAEFVINQPGSYYLTTNIVCTNNVGIETFANNITLDLNGFSLTGASGAGSGIYIVNGFSRIRVNNGIVNGWSNAGINSAANDVILEGLVVSGNGSGAILSASFGNVLRNSTLDGNTNYGVWFYQNSGIMDNLVVSSNGSAGIYFELCANDTVRDCTVDGNGSYGVYFSGSGNSIVTDCAINGNNSYGVNCASSTNADLERLTILGNNNSGINFGGSGCVISACGINGNDPAAIDMAGSGCFIHDNNCAGSMDGIFVTGSNNRIEANHITVNGGAGLEFGSPGTNNIAVRNSVEGSGANDYYFVTPQITGPIITNAVLGMITNSNPWANFGF